jgi:MFS family permease
LPLGKPASLAVSAGVVGHALWTSAAPALTYRLYASEWRLSPAVTMGLFAAYPIAVVAVLAGLGGLSDRIGRRCAMLLGLGFSLLGAVFLAVAPDVGWVFAGRALMGIGVGLSAGPATAAVLEFSSHPDSKRAASLTIAAQAGGFAAGLLVGGALTEYAPWPTHLCFWVLAAVLLVLLAATWRLPRDSGREDRSATRRKAAFVPKELRRAFATASMASMTAYTFGVLVLSLGGQVEHDLIGSPNALLNGAVLALFPLVLGPVGIAAKVLSPRIALSVGSVASASGMGLLALAVARHDLVTYLSATAVAGAGYSLLFIGSLQLITSAAPLHQRGGVLSALYLLAYLSMAVVALVLGVIATARGLAFAVDLGAATIAAMSASTLLLANIGRKQEAD